MRLGINIDHIATIRNARGGSHPDPIKAAVIAEQAGADLIVAHLREDRRHIKEKDVIDIIKNIKIPLQLEIAPTSFMFNFAIKNNLKKVCIVPEKRKELTTEGGLNLDHNLTILKRNIPKLLKNNIEVSFFLDPELKSIDSSIKLGIHAIEFHTGEYANADISKEKIFLDKLSSAINYANTNGISARAGHGLNYEKVKKIIKINGIEELNIGHFIIGESIFDGLPGVVKKMKKIIKDYS